MTINSHYLEVSGLTVEVVRKKIKNLHLAVYPPEGAVRVAVPLHISDENVRMAVISRLSWIKRRQAYFNSQPRQSERLFVTGESHYFWGRRYILEVNEDYSRPYVKVKNNARILLSVQPDTTKDAKAKIMANWYRRHIKKIIPLLLEKWQPVVGKKITDWRVQKMKTKWGSCNISSKRILLNLELAKKSPECLEYILVHELVHLHERNHNDNFCFLMDQFMPKWRSHRDLLKKEPLAFENWDY